MLLVLVNMLASSSCIQPNSLTTLSSQKTAQMTWTGGTSEEVVWLIATHKEVYNKLLWDDGKTPSASSKASQTHPFPPRGQSCCLTHSTMSHSLRAVINAVVIGAICYIQTIHGHRQSSSHTHTALMADFQRKTVASCLHMLFVNIALFLQEPGKPTGSKDAC